MHSVAFVILVVLLYENGKLGQNYQKAIKTIIKTKTKKKKKKKKKKCNNNNDYNNFNNNNSEHNIVTDKSEIGQMAADTRRRRCGGDTKYLHSFQPPLLLYYLCHAAMKDVHRNTKKKKVNLNTYFEAVAKRLTLNGILPLL